MNGRMYPYSWYTNCEETSWFVSFAYRLLHYAGLNRGFLIIQFSVETDGSRRKNYQATD